MARWKRLVTIATAGIVILLLFITLFLPGIISGQAKSWVDEQTTRELVIGGISINPLSLTITIEDLALSEGDGETSFVAWKTLRVSLSAASLFHLAPIIDELYLDKPALHLERLADNRFNFSDLLPPAAEPEAEPATGTAPSRFAIDNLTIRDGQIELVDRHQAEVVHHTVRDLNLALPSIGNLPHMVENPVTPFFQATINDAPIELRGKAVPFTDTQEMRFSLEVANIDLPHYLAYVPVELPINLRSALLSFDLDLVYEVAAESGPKLEISGQADLASLNIHDRLDEQMFFMPLLQVEIAPSQILETSLNLKSVRVYNLAVQLHRDAKGRWNHARLKMVDEAGPEKSSAESAGDSSFTLQVDEFQVRDGEIHFSDQQVPGGFKTVAREINIDVNNFALDSSEPSPFQLELKTSREETLQASGKFQLKPFTLGMEADVGNLAAGAYAPYYATAYAKPLGGHVNLAAQLDINSAQPLLISDGSLRWHQASVAFNEEEGVALNLVEVTDLTYDLAENRLDVASTRLKEGQVSFSRDKSGAWSFLSHNFPILKKLAESSQNQKKQSTEPTEPEFSYRIGTLSVDDWRFDIRDEQPATPVRLQATDFELTLRNLAGPENVESPFTFRTTVQKSGRIELDGALSLAAGDVKLDGRIQQLPLAGLAPYAAEQSNLVLKSGTLNARFGLSLASGEEDLHVGFEGDVGINHFSVLDGIHREDLLKWNSLQVAGINGQMPPMIVQIDSITLSDYFAKVLIDEKARLNLAEAFRQEDLPDNAPQAAEAAGKELLSTRDEPRPEIRIDTVVLQGGQVDFTDRHLKKIFYADMQELGGRISGLSSDPSARAEVDLRGSLRNHSPLEINGTVNPLAEELFLDLRLTFRDIDLSPMSPYSGTYVGYLIEKGKLNLALDYFIEDNRLKAKNEVFLDQFTFGEPVESDKATSLPVKLAVALLRDRNGEIHLDIPVSGNLNDPQFSIGGVIWSVIKNLLVKAATSPLALLGAVLGAGDEDFSSVNFPYGSAKLPPPEQEKLLKMAQGLLNRPSLNLEISGYVDPENDPEGYRRVQLREKIKRAKYQELAADEALPEGATLESIEVNTDEYPEYLWEVYKEADFPKPRNFIGLTKNIPPKEQEKLIYANTEVGEEELARLAQARVRAVQSFLVDQGEFPTERIFLRQAEIRKPPDEEGTSHSRVEFDVNIK